MTTYRMSDYEIRETIAQREHAWKFAASEYERAEIDDELRELRGMLALRAARARRQVEGRNEMRAR